MELIDYVRMLGRRWMWWLSLLLIGTIAGIGYASAQTKIYSATTESYVANAVAGNAGDAKSTNDRILNSMPSYSALVDTPSVLQGVLNDVPTNLTENQLAGRLSAVHLARTVVLRVTATSSKPALAQALSDAAAKRLAAAIVNLETPTATSPSTVRVVITRPAPLPKSPSSPNKKVDILLGVIAGLGLGLLTASLRDQAVRSRGTTAASTPAAAEPLGWTTEPTALRPVSRAHEVVVPTTSREHAVVTEREPSTLDGLTPEPAEAVSGHGTGHGLSEHADHPPAPGTR